MEKTKKVKPLKKRACEYKLPNICQKTPDVQLVFRAFADVNLAKYWACHNCAEIVEKEMKMRELTSDFKKKAPPKK